MAGATGTPPAPDDTGDRERWVRFGRELRAWRRRAGLTQQQLGAGVGYHHSLISRVEGGVREPPPGLPERLDRLLGAGGVLSALAAPSPVGGGRSVRPPPLPGTAPGGTRIPLSNWPAQLPEHGLACPLHGSVGCPVPAPTDLPAMLSIDHRRAPGTDPAVVHGLAALLLAYTRASLEELSTEIIGSVERVLHVVAGWAAAGGTGVRPLLPFAANYAQLAGRLRMQRGQATIGMAWFSNGLRWADGCDDVTARATLLSDLCTLARLDHDAASSLGYARALGAVDPGRGWVVTLSHLYLARAYALAGDVTGCRRQVALSRHRLSRLDGRDADEAPWLCGADGQVRVEAAAAGALRDLAVVTGDVATARRAVRASGRALANLPAQMRPSYLLLTLRLADSYACAADPEAALATAGPVLAEAARAHRTTIRRELRGLRRRLDRWSDLPAAGEFTAALIESGE